LKLLWFNLRVDKNRPGLAFAIDWLNTVAEQVDQIDVITMDAGNYEVRQNVRVYSVGKEKGYSELRRAIEFYRILGRLVIHQRYNACFAHMMPLFAVMAAPLLHLRHIPIILWYTHKSVTLLLRLATLLVDRVVTASPESFRIHSSKVRVIGHGIDPDRFVPKTHESSLPRPFTVLTVNRLSPVKRVDLLINAVALLCQKKPELSICLKIVGGPLIDRDRTYVAELQRQVEQYQLQDRVIFVGSVPFQDVLLYYQEADCFVNMSETGSVDKAVLEAMSCGIVVVVNPIFSGILGPELAKTLVVDWNAEQLCDRLLLIISLSELDRCQLGKRLRDIVVHDHNLSGLCDKLMDEFRQISK
jgi:glycosyltransferase involved in cell wall biosynthesis